jgi:hypothetical protein
MRQKSSRVPLFLVFMILARRWSRKAYQRSILGNPRQSSDVAEAKHTDAGNLSFKSVLGIHNTAIAEADHEYRDEGKYNRSSSYWSIPVAITVKE